MRSAKKSGRGTSKEQVFKCSAVPRTSPARVHCCWVGWHRGERKIQTTTPQSSHQHAPQLLHLRGSRPHLSSPPTASPAARTPSTPSSSCTGGPTGRHRLSHRCLPQPKALHHRQDVPMRAATRVGARRGWWSSAGESRRFSRTPTTPQSARALAATGRCQCQSSTLHHRRRHDQDASTVLIPLPRRAASRVGAHRESWASAPESPSFPRTQTTKQSAHAPVATGPYLYTYQQRVRMTAGCVNGRLKWSLPRM